MFQTQYRLWRAWAADILITLNKRLETAAAAIAQRMINRRSPLVFRPVLPRRNGSTEVAAMMSRCWCEDQSLHLQLTGGFEAVLYIVLAT